MSWFPTMIARLSKEMPRLQVDVDVGNAERLIEGLEHGRLDVAIVSGIVNPSRYVCFSLGFERMRWVCTPAVLAHVQVHHLVSRRARLSPSSVSREADG